MKIDTEMLKMTLKRSMPRQAIKYKVIIVRNGPTDEYGYFIKVHNAADEKKIVSYFVTENGEVEGPENCRGEEALVLLGLVDESYKIKKPKSRKARGEEMARQARIQRLAKDAEKHGSENPIPTKNKAFIDRVDLIAIIILTCLFYIVAKI